jgi:hypothetical protein
VNGQWVGKFTGTNTGTVIFDVDDLGSHFEGWAYVYDDHPSLPGLMAFLKTEDKSNSLELDVALNPLYPPLADPREWKDISSHYPLLTNIASKAHVKITWDAVELRADASTDVGTSIQAHAARTSAEAPSPYTPSPDIANWVSFRNYALALETDRYIFRGQRKPWRLRTRYHRTRRADLRRYQMNDLEMLYRAIVPRTKHVFDRSIPDQFGAFLNLVQHHGYPTPLLDWTYSPFVAAFFAYWRVMNIDASEADTDERVRIFVFDRRKWHEKFKHIPFLRPAGLNLSIMDFMPLENERAIPQQSVSTVTNIDDVEAYIVEAERTSGHKYLTVVELPVYERRDVMRGLRMMGITASTLFPGLDGVCEDFRERSF